MFLLRKLMFPDQKHMFLRLKLMYSDWKYKLSHCKSTFFSPFHKIIIIVFCVIDFVEDVSARKNLNKLTFPFGPSS